MSKFETPCFTARTVQFCDGVEKQHTIACNAYSVEKTGDHADRVQSVTLQGVDGALGQERHLFPANFDALYIMNAQGVTVDRFRGDFEARQRAKADKADESVAGQTPAPVAA
jgi:hypothetical protein